jgi:hypothetical protein
MPARTTLYGPSDEGSNDDLFDFQDRIATGIVSAMGRKVLEAETLGCAPSLPRA